LFCGDESDTRHNVSKCPLVTEAVKLQFYDRVNALDKAN
jgi:hypothetical protein